MYDVVYNMYMYVGIYLDYIGYMYSIFTIDYCLKCYFLLFALNQFHLAMYIHTLLLVEYLDLFKI